MKVGDRVILTEQSRVLMGFKGDMEGTVIDILRDEPYPYVVNLIDMGEDHREFFDRSELIILEGDGCKNENKKDNL